MCVHVYRDTHTHVYIYDHIYIFYTHGHMCIYIRVFTLRVCLLDLSFAGAQQSINAGYAAGE